MEERDAASTEISDTAGEVSELSTTVPEVVAAVAVEVAEVDSANTSDQTAADAVDAADSDSDDEPPPLDEDDSDDDAKNTASPKPAQANGDDATATPSPAGEDADLAQQNEVAPSSAMRSRRGSSVSGTPLKKDFSQTLDQYGDLFGAEESGKYSTWPSCHSYWLFRIGLVVKRHSFA